MLLKNKCYKTLYSANILVHDMKIYKNEKWLFITIYKPLKIIFDSQFSALIFEILIQG